MENRTNVGDLIGGLMVAAVGLFFVVNAAEYDFGETRQMGPAYFPTVVGIIAIAIGLVVAVLAFRTSASLPTFSWRALAAVLTGILVFAVTIGRLGFLPAAFLSVVISALGTRSVKRRTILVLGVGVALGSWVVFSLGLGMTTPAFIVPR